MEALSRSFFDSSSRGYGVDAFLALAPAIRSTQAYRDSSWALHHDLNGFLQRGHDYSKLRQFLSERSPERLLIFHHFDRRGLLPQSWCDALIFLQNSGWQVVLSSSQLAPSVISSLNRQ